MDESHPSLAGSYAAACCFYALIFNENPMDISYNAGLNPSVASDIRNAVKLVFSDSSAAWNIGRFTAKSSFTTTLMKPLEVSFENTSIDAESYVWHFGDGDSSYAFAPTHTYKSAGIYEVSLLASKCGVSQKSSKNLSLSTTGNISFGNASNAWKIYPNPSDQHFYVAGENSKAIMLSLYNLKGQEILSEPMTGNLTKVNTCDLPEGFYVLRILGENCELARQKLLIQK
jgi:PKD repeat protein